MISYRKLSVGDPAPWFQQQSSSNPDYHFDTVAGRYVLMGFYLTADDAHGQAMLQVVQQHRYLFDDANCAFFGVSIDANDMLEQRVEQSLPGIRYFWDFDCRISRLYGAAPAEFAPDEKVVLRRFWLLLDPALRVVAYIPRQPNGQEVEQLLNTLKHLPPVSAYLGFAQQAPVLFIPHVFEADFCQQLIDLYQQQGGEDSGFMREVNGKTTGLIDYGHKRRTDSMINNADIQQQIQQRFIRKVLPEVLKVHHFQVTRIERYLVGCYSSQTADHFKPHRDNTSKGTAYRKFAVSINLNDDFSGGELSFPEYSPISYKMPKGMAVVFSCSLLHTVSPMISGKRYAFLPFLYDDAAAQLREQNNAYLEDDNKKYYQKT